MRLSPSLLVLLAASVAGALRAPVRARPAVMMFKSKDQPAPAFTFKVKKGATLPNGFVTTKRQYQPNPAFGSLPPPPPTNAGGGRGDGDSGDGSDIGPLALLIAMTAVAVPAGKWVVSSGLLNALPSLSLEMASISLPALPALPSFSFEMSSVSLPAVSLPAVSLPTAPLRALLAPFEDLLLLLASLRVSASLEPVTVGSKPVFGAGR